MKATNWLLLAGSLVTTATFAQEGNLIDGRVRLLDGKVIPVEIVNRSTNESTLTDETGYYLVVAKEGDTLRFLSKLSATSDYIISKEDLKTGRVNILLSKPGQNLEEIVILKKDLGSDFLGMGERSKLSPAEINYRKNNTLTSATKTGGLGISIDAIVNLLSGKRKRDKQAIVYERLETAVNAFLEEYPKENLVKDLNIPKERVDAFLYYLVDQPDFRKVPIDESEGYKLFLAKHYNEFLDFMNIKD